MSYLRPPSVFAKVEDGNHMLDSCYLFTDVEKGEFVRSGVAEASFEGRGKQHLRASKGANSLATHSRFYSTYPHKDAEHVNLSMKRGNFQDLHQLVGLGVQRVSRQGLISLFEWDEYELDMLKSLKAPSADHSGMDHKKYKHLIYFFETAFAIAIKPECNLSDNPGNEWQLKYVRVMNAK